VHKHTQRRYSLFQKQPLSIFAYSSYFKQSFTGTVKDRAEAIISRRMLIAQPSLAWVIIAYEV